MFDPFTGGDAVYGQSLAAGCFPAVRLINGAGGVMGHQLRCVAVDTRGDPADAVPAASKMLATTSNLVGILGPSADEATATVPTFAQAKIPMFVSTGQVVFNHTIVPYFWRIGPADDAGGTALALWAKHLGYLRGAAFFGNDAGAQGSVPALTSTYSKLGGTLVTSQNVALHATSYGSEIERIVNANPQVLFTEADPQTSATSLRNLQQLHGLIPVLGTNATLTPEWLKAVAGAIGAQNLSKYYTGVEPYAAAAGPAWQAYDKALLGSSSDVQKPSQWADQQYAMAPYDGVNVMALAMLAAKSTDPATYNSYVLKVTRGGTGTVKVNTFAAGASALAKGEHIQYVGATGEIAFDQWHNAQGEFAASAYQPDGHLRTIGTISAAELAANS